MNPIDIEFIKKVEAADFRTCHDTGANSNAMYIWNKVREHVGLPRITIDDLPKFCATHDTYHILRFDYGCVGRESQPLKGKVIAQ